MKTRITSKITMPVLIAALTVFSVVTAIAAPGDLDPTFSGDGKLTDLTGIANGVAIQADGKIILAGWANDNSFSLTRYNTDSSPDFTFGVNGRVTTTFGLDAAESRAVAVQSDGKIVAVGYVCPCDGDYGSAAFAVARYHPDGTLDLSFDGDGKVTTEIGLGVGNWSVAVQPDNKIIVAGSSFTVHPQVWDDDFTLIRYNSNGSLDTTFDQDGIVITSICCGDGLRSVALQPDGKIVAAGSSTAASSTGFVVYNTVARYNDNGSLDATFGSGGIVLTPSGDSQYGAEARVQGDGKIVVGEESWTGSSWVFTLTRYNSNGSLDTTFDSDGKVTMSGFSGADIAIQSDGRIVAAGTSNNGSNDDFALVRYNSNGSLDNTIGGGDGKATADFNNSIDSAHGLALDNRGRAVVVGESGGQFAIARFLLRKPANVDFDGDGKTDTSVFNSSSGTWRIRNASGDRNYTWGIPGDRLVPADYDGDGKADVAVWRPATGEWLVINSRDGAFSRYTWGVAEDQPVPADYDGDGRSDFATYRPSTGQWFLVKRRRGFEIRNWGEPGDVPVVGDFDGDVRADISVWRPSSGTWYLNRSTAGVGTVTWGVATDRVANADYDGDQKDDVAVWRPSTGEWFVIRSSDGAVSVSNWGVSGDIPVSGDYDGDGVADPAIYRDGTWYLKRSAAGLDTVTLGTAADVPVLAAN